MNRVILTQGTCEWHEHRAKYDNASEAPSVLGINPWFPQTPLQLHQMKTGMKVVEQNSFMKRGLDYEEEARISAEEDLNVHFSPCVCVKDRYSASLDGVTEDGNIGLEIKIPAKGMKSDTWKKVAKGEVPGNYLAQMGQQWYCSGVKSIVLYLYDPETKSGMVTNIPEMELKEWWERVEKAWDAYHLKVDAGLSPDPMEGDIVSVSDPESVSHAEKVISLRSQIAHLEALLKAEEDALKASLPADMGSVVKTPSGVLSASWVERQGSVDYSTIPQLANVNLDLYRKKATRYIKFTVVE